ncbi:MAG: hypothetical protein IJ867_08420 [Clostridia bacterium]|nr:hypothetical protein [Clostridia bacterium]
MSKYLGLSTFSLKTSQIKNCNELGSLIGLKSLTLENNKSFSDISGLSTLKNLTTLVLDGNNITNLSPLLGTINESGKIGYTSSLNLSNNPSLDGYTFGDNIAVLLKLHAAGLKKVTLTGCSFSGNEIQELINGKTIDGVTYAGFGSGNVIN